MGDEAGSGRITCQAGWLVAVMWSAGAIQDVIGPCAERAGYRIVMRLSELGYAAVFDVGACRDHHEDLRRSPYYDTSQALDP
ncbi:hypothetical protein [Actinoplanes sp. NPDC049118]|uniref:hypothetical protein n=1 Tax=Actinoplanes sp. NPDC049118 TaxID=3155769 RepID=UPI0033CD2067